MVLQVGEHVAALAEFHDELESGGSGEGVFEGYYGREFVKSIL